MSSIDKRVVEMQFDNGQFESGTKTSMKTVELLKKSLNFDDSVKSLNGLSNAGKRFSLAGIADGLENISNRFSAMGIVGITILQNITNAVINLGKQMITSLAIDPLKKGLQEYETQIGAIQTILANTSSKGTTLEEVNAALDELNTYSDKTIYNFTEMTKNIGTFTAAGVDLKTSTAAIKGIANLAAVSGSNAQQASTAMYQLSQAMAAGTVKLMDWNSVVNAGMGGEVFKNALMDTARVHGVAIDQMVKTEGSFRETLTKGWLTTQILTETLSKFTGDLTAEQLKSMGYTEAQTTAIMKMAQTANDAATKVKTFTQLWDTISEAIQSGWAQSWRIVLGDFEEAKSFFTEISGVLGGLVAESSDSRNKFLQGWKDLGGRTAAIYALRNAFDAVVNVVKTFTQAFSEIFPPMTSKQLFDITNALRLFSINLVKATKDNEKLKSVFRGIAAIFDIVIRAVSAVIGAFGRLIGAIMPTGDSILSFLAKIGDYITGVDKAIKETDFFNKVIANIAGFLMQAKAAVVEFFNKVTEVFGKLKSWFKDIFSNIDTSGFKTFGSAISKVLEKVKERFNIFQKPDLSGLPNFIESVKNKLGPALSNMGNGIGKLFGNIGKAIQDNISKVNWKNVFDAANVALIGGLLISIQRFINNGASVFSGIKDVVGGVTGILDGVRDSIKTWQTSIKAKTLMTIALSIAVLAGALTMLALIDSQRLTSASLAVTALFANLVAAMAIFEKVGIGGSAKMAVTLIGISAAILIISAAMTVLSKIDKDKIAQGLMAIGAVLAELVVFLKLTGGSQNVISTAIGLNILGLALLVIAAAMKKFGDMPTDTIQNGLMRMGTAMAILFAAVKLMPKDMPVIGLGLMLIAFAIEILSKAISSMGNIDWNVMQKGLIGMAASLGIIAVGTRAMQGALPGAAALLVITAAFAILVPVLKALGSIPIEQIGTALLTMVGVFAILGVAGLVLGPIVPVLLGLGAAMLLLGLGGAAVGAGLLAFSAGIASLAAVGAVGATAIVAFMTIILGLIPLIITAFVGAIALFATGIASIAPVVMTAFTTLLMQFITAVVNVTPSLIAALGQLLIQLIALIVTVIPQFVNAVFLLLTSLLQTLASYIPQIIQAGFDILLGLLSGIANNIGQVVTTAITIITNFIDGVAAGLPRIIQSGVNLILSFIEGLTQAIRDNQPRVTADAMALGDAIIDGVAAAVTSGVGKVVDLVVGLAKQALEAMKKALGISSPSKEFMKIGQYSTEGLAVGLTRYANNVTRASTALGDKAVNSLSDVSGRIADSINGNIDMSPHIRPVVDLSNVLSGGKQIDKMLSGKTINVSATANKLSSVSNGMQSQINTPGTTLQNGSNQQISFTQINNSPEALSRIEIYRQTKNQLIMLKGLVPNT